MMTMRDSVIVWELGARGKMVDRIALPPTVVVNPPAPRSTPCLFSRSLRAKPG